MKHIWRENKKEIHLPEHGNVTEYKINEWLIFFFKYGIKQ